MCCASAGSRSLSSWRTLRRLSASAWRAISKGIDVHLLALFPNGVFLEYFPWLDDLLVKPLKIENGMARVPSEPRLGIEFKPEAIWEYKVG